MAIINFNSISGVSTISVASSITVGNNVAIGTNTVTAGSFIGNLTGTASTATAAATAYGLSGSPTLSGITSISTTNLTVNGNAYPSAGPLSGTRNRIINGDMRIDQRNAGATVSISGLTVAYTLDRWAIRSDTEAVVSIQQSSTAPNGFRNSLLYTVTTADASLGTSQNYSIQQRIEGFNMSDFGWGTASAQSVTLSFWVRSSLTGTFGGAISNSAANRSYPFTYSISVGDTWEYKTVVILGDTSGTWLTSNGVGAYLYLSTGAGTTVSGTADVWAGADYRSATGATSVVGTNGATFYITGVQLEAGTVATPFERRSFGDEMARCQRYYVKTFDYSTAPAQNLGGIGSLNFVSQGNILFDVMWRYPVELRARPGTVTTYSTNAASANWSTNGDTPTASALNIGTLGMLVRADTPAAGGRAYFIHATAEAEL